MDEEISIGNLFEELERVLAQSATVAVHTTEVYEVQLAGLIHDLGSVVTDVLYLVREHLSCHDCEIPDHFHTSADNRVRRVVKVFPGEMKGGVDASTEGTNTPQDSSSSDHGRT